MVSRFFGSNPFDESIEKATSETISKGQEDLALNLEISDQIRSKQVQPKDAMRALKRKVTQTKPSVQLLALSLTDTCVKNGGHHFLIEIASREFVDSLVGIIKSPPSSCDPGVKATLLGLIQTWALAFDGKPELVYVTETYRLLKHEGYVFPKVDKSTSIMMIDTATPPEWSDSDYCVRCRTSFTITNRKHHCRNCGQTFCGECSSKTIPLPHIGINQPVRVCDACLIVRQAKTKSVDTKPTPSVPSSDLPTTDGYDIRIPSENEEDDDFKKAIELSLKDTRKQVVKAPEPIVKQEEEIDEDLAAAIAASLKDLNISQSMYDKSSTTSIQKDQNELSQIEADNIYKFSDLLEKIQQSGSDLIRDRQVQELYDRIGELKPKLTKNLTETIQKHQDLVEMHGKLSQVIKLYDRLLEDRMSNTYSRRTSSIYAGTQRVTSPVSSSNTGIVYPSIQQSSANLYSPSSLYPLASAPSPSPTYFPMQTSLTQNTQPNALEIVPTLNQQSLAPLQQISYLPNAPLQQQFSYLPNAPLQQQTSYLPNAPLQQQFSYVPNAPLQQQISYLPNAPLQQISYDPNAPLQQISYDPNAPLQQISYDPNAPLQQISYDPNAPPPQQISYDPNAPPPQQISCDPNIPQDSQQPQKIEEPLIDL